MRQVKDKTVQKTVRNILLTIKNPDDREVIGMINDLARATPGIKPKDSLKNHLFNTLPHEIKKRRENQLKTLAS